MEGIPADIEDWGLVRVFHEGGRLLRKHFGDFLPAIVVFIFPASIIKVLYAQFCVEDFIGPQLGSRNHPEANPFWVVLLHIFLNFVPNFLFLIGFFVISQILSDKVYVCTDSKTEHHSKSFYATMKLALTRVVKHKTDTEYSALPNNSSGTTSKGKVLKALIALVVCLVLFIIVSQSGIQFTPEVIAAMGLPPLSIFLLTLVVALATTLVTSYVELVVLVVDIWVMSPGKPNLSF